MPDRVECMDEVEEDRKGFELVYGEWVEKPCCVRASITNAKLGTKLTTFADARSLGHVFASEAGFQLFPDIPTLIRKPSVSFVASGRFPYEKLPSGFCKFPPDLAVLTVPFEQLADALEQKIDEYLRAGVKLVWVVYPNTQVVYVYRPDGTAARKTVTESLDGEAVLPGLTVPIADLFIGM